MSDPNWKDQIIGYLENEDREHAHQTALAALESGMTDIRTLYEEVLAPALNGISGEEEKEAETIWREHVMTAIVRGIVESAYPYVIRERDARGAAPGRKVLIFCPAGETHELGARMAADFFLIWGHQAIFIGADTPEKTLLDAIERTRPDWLCLSVSNDFNLFSAKRLVSDLRARFGADTRIFAGGRAIAKTPTAYADIGADGAVNGFADIGKLSGDTAGETDRKGGAGV